MKKILSVLLLSLIIWSCGEDNEPTVAGDNYDRKAMLTNWADNIIMPGYEAYADDLASFAEAKNQFITSPNEVNLTALREAWLSAYVSWQKVAMFEIGKAEEITLRDFTNIYPANTAEIETNISSGSYDLQLPSSRDEQGFPAIDYLINGSAASDAEIVGRFQQEARLKSYLGELVDKLNTMTTTVLNDWKNGYRETFINNDGSTASSSVNKLANDFMYYYESSLRAGKIGIPAGVFSTSPLSNRVEAYYKQDVSKLLFETALQACIDFFNGTYYDGTGEGESFNTYLDFLNTVSDGESLSKIINTQFAAAQTQGSALSDNFVEQINTDNQLMLKTYDQLQAGVVLIKVDMFQALSIKVDFVDADGD